MAGRAQQAPFDVDSSSPSSTFSLCKSLRAVNPIEHMFFLVVMNLIESAGWFQSKGKIWEDILHLISSYARFTKNTFRSLPPDFVGIG